MTKGVKTRENLEKGSPLLPVHCPWDYILPVGKPLTWSSSEHLQFFFSSAVHEIPP